MEELIEENRIEDRTRIAEKMLQRGKLSEEEIADDLDLPLEKVKELAPQLQPQLA